MILGSNPISNNDLKTRQNINNNLTHSRNSSIDFIINANNKTHSRKSSYEILSSNNYTAAAAAAAHHYTASVSHSRNQSLDLIKTDLGILLNNSNITNATAGNNIYASNNQIKEANNVQVNIITGHLNWIAVAHPHFVTCYKMKDGIGWQLVNNKKISFD